MALQITLKKIVKRKEEWAACYRKESLVNTNMYVHRSLSLSQIYIYLKGNVNKRLDKCIGISMKLARDKGFERLVKLEKGKNSGRIHQIKVWHQESKKMSVDLVNQLEEHAAWEIRSTDGKTIYQGLQLNKFALILAPLFVKIVKSVFTCIRVTAQMY